MPLASMALFGAFLLALAMLRTAIAAPLLGRDGLKVRLSLADGLLSTNSVQGRVMLMFAPAGVDPLEDWDVTSTPDNLYGENVIALSTTNPVTLVGGSPYPTDTAVWGYPNISMSNIAAGEYSVQAFLNIYSTVTRSDGSTVSVRFPCGDGAQPVDGYGSLKTTLANITVYGGDQTVDLTFDSTEPYPRFNGTEIGGCSQGNYQDTDFIKYLKTRSDVLSAF